MGGGLAGLSVALELARRGRQVTLLEGSRIAWGASGRNGGSVSPAFSAGADAIRRHVDEEHYRALYRLSMEAWRSSAPTSATWTSATPTRSTAACAWCADAGDALQRWCDEQQRVFERDVRVLARPAARAAGDRGLFPGAWTIPRPSISIRSTTRAPWRGIARWVCASTRIRRRRGWRWRARSSRSPPPAAGRGAHRGAGHGRLHRRAATRAATGHAAHRHLHHADRAAGRARAKPSAATPPSATTAAPATTTGCSMAGASAGAVESPPGSTTRPTWPRRCAANCCRFTRNCRACAWKPPGRDAPTRAT